VKPSRAVLAALAGCAVVVLIGVQVLLPEPSHSFLWPDIYNAGHAPLYGLVALAFLAILRWRGAGPGLRPYLQSLALTVAAGVLAEGIQALGPGEPGIGDVLRDALGATAFLLGASAFGHGRMYGSIRLPRRVVLLLAGLLLIPAFIPLAGSTVAVIRTNMVFPRLCDFDHSWETKYVVAQEAELSRETPPEGWGHDPANRAGHLSFHKGAYPGIAIRILHSDWTGYRALVFEAYSELPAPVELVLTVHESGHGLEYHDRFNRALVIKPGANRISVLLEDMRSAPRGREMDMSRLGGLVLFADHPPAPFDLYLDAFHLE